MHVTHTTGPSSSESHSLFPYGINQSELATRELDVLNDAYLNTNWNLQLYFGHIKVITMDATSERFKRCQEELAKVGLQPHEYEIPPAVNGSKLEESLWSRVDVWDIRKGLVKGEKLRLRQQGIMGCFMAHYAAIKDTHERYKEAVEALNSLNSRSQVSPAEHKAARDTVRKFSSLLLIEDNNGFGHVTGPCTAELEDYGRRFRLAMKDLTQWDMFYFMSMKKARFITPNIAKLETGLTTKCFAINCTMYERIVSALESRLKSGEKLEPVDNELSKLHKTSNAYVATPALTYRIASLSEVGGSLHKEKEEKPADRTHWQSQVEVFKE